MIIPSSKGLIALDIDGTLTADKHSIPIEVIEFLSSLEKKGWAFIFITGRPFEWGYQTLQAIPFPFIFAVQNGALLLELPSKKIINRHYLTPDIIPPLDSICKAHGTDFVVYSGYENEDLCYYRTDYFSSDMLDYLMHRKQFLVEKWLEVSSFNDLPVQVFTSFKCFAQEKQAHDLSLEIERQLGLHSPPIRDPFRADYYIIQATHPQASKGMVLQEILTAANFKGPVIAAGDDNNDYGMLQAAHIKIAMADAPPNLLAIADIISPSAAERGLIQGLTHAIERVSNL